MISESRIRTPGPVPPAATRHTQWARAQTALTGEERRWGGEWGRGGGTEGGRERKREGESETGRERERGGWREGGREGGREREAGRAKDCGCPARVHCERSRAGGFVRERVRDGGRVPD